MIGSLRREILDHVIVLGENHLRRIVSDYLTYYHEIRPHQSLDQNAPIPRKVDPPQNGRVISTPMVGGLHHRYTRELRNDRYAKSDLGHSFTRIPGADSRQTFQMAGNGRGYSRSTVSVQPSHPPQT